jgi:hypothetical protein
MERISSAGAVFYKWFYPAFGIVALAFVLAPVITEPRARSNPTVIIWMILAIVVVIVLLWRFVGSLANEVFDCGDELLVRGRGKEERVNLSSIINVNEIPNSSPPTITLTLDKPSRYFGSEISFSPSSTPSGRLEHSRLFEELIRRVDRARSRRQATIERSIM